MFRSPDEILEARAAIFEQFRKGEITPALAIERLREREPNSTLAFSLESDLLRESGDLDGAEAALWRALAGAPCGVGSYFGIAALHERRGDDAAAVLPFRLLGLNQIAQCDEVSQDVAKNFAELGKAASKPAAYALLAERTKEALGDAPWPERLTPYRLLTEIQRQAESGLEPDLLRDILSRYADCEPVFRAALRQWTDDEAPPLSDESASILLALLGEGGGPELIDDLFADDQYPTTPVMWHAQWAIRRLGERYPAEAFERLQALAPAADTTARGILAEQFYLLPPSLPGRKEAILHLLDGFPPEDDPEEAAYLLLTVSTLMEMLGSPVDGRAVMKKHQRRLDAKTRRTLNEMLGDDPPFVPNLIALALEDISIEDVVVDLALMESPEDEHHHHDEFDEFDDDLDDEDDEPAEPRPGRNDPCWCGSGKKYKKCHLLDDEVDARLANSDEAAEFAKVLNDIIETAVNKLNRADVAVATRMFFEREPGMLDPDEDDSAAFMQWIVLHFRAPSTGRNMIEEFLRRRGGRLPERERSLVDGFRQARYGLWEVTRVDKGLGVELKDHFGDEQIFIEDPRGSRRGIRGDLLIAYVYPRSGHLEFFEEAVAIPRALISKLEAAVESGSRDAKMTPSEYFRSRSHEWRRVLVGMGRDALAATTVINRDGDAFELSTAVYEVVDADAAEAALLTARVFSRSGPGQVAWLDSPDAKTGTVFGTIRIADGQFRLECNSRKRLAIGRQLVEKHAGQFLRHTGDQFQPVDDPERAREALGSEPEA